MRLIHNIFSRTLHKIKRLHLLYLHLIRFQHLIDVTHCIPDIRIRLQSRHYSFEKKNRILILQNFCVNAEFLITDPQRISDVKI